MVDAVIGSLNAAATFAPAATPWRAVRRQLARSTRGAVVSGPVLVSNTTSTQ